VVAVTPRRLMALRHTVQHGMHRELELSPLVYDEIERKLLEGGHGHRFEAGPGSGIDMTGVVLTREKEANR
jgi:hypothetical protein